jgi:hypothetical protein
MRVTAGIIGKRFRENPVDIYWFSGSGSTLLVSRNAHFKMKERRTNR